MAATPKSRAVLLFVAMLLASNASIVVQAQKQKPVPAPAAATTPAAKLQGLDDLASSAMKEWKVPGVAIAVVQDGKVIYAKGYGFRDLEQKLPVTTATLFPIGSITKSFTALTFAILKNEGKVDWDKPVRSYLPEFQMSDPVASEQDSRKDFRSPANVPLEPVRHRH